MKKLAKILCFILVFAIALVSVACSTSKNGTNTSGDNQSSGSTVVIDDTTGDSGFNYTGDAETDDKDAEYNSDEQQIVDKTENYVISEETFSDTVYGEDVTVIESTSEMVTIKSDGSYLLSGTYTGGVTVKKGVTAHIYLENATITDENQVMEDESDPDDTFSVKKGGSVTITLIGENKITSDNASALSSNSPLTINGEGTLNVSSTAKNGIKVKNSLVIVDATINVTAVNHGISVYNLNAKDCTVNVTTSNNGEAKDGIHAEMANPSSEEEIASYGWTADDGFIILNDVNYTCDVEGDGIQADTFVYINGGTYDIKTTAKFVSYSQANLETYGLEADDFRYRYSNGVYYKQASEEIKSLTSSNYYAMIQGTKGIKVGEIDYEVEDADGNVTASGEITDGNYYILIEDGTFTINSADDAIHANSGSVTINGGSFTITTLDDGVASDYLTKINGGEIEVNYCYEGIEGSYVEINGGTIKLNYCLDDGINAASDYNVTEYILINGGDIYVNAYGDGIDSNGTITINGGKVFVDGPENGGNGSLDTENGLFINGGYVVAVGSSQWVNEATPKTSSKQYSLVYSGSTISKGTTLTLKDSSGNIVVSFTTGKSSSSVVISAPEIKTGTYTLYAGNTTLTTFSVTSTVTTVGTTSGGGQFGPGQGGFNPGQGGFPGRR